MNAAATVAAATTETEKTLRIFDTHIGAWEETQDFLNTENVRKAIVSRLRARGWKMHRDEQWKALNVYLGRLGALEVTVESCGRHAKAEFFCGDRRGLARFAGMPRVVQLRCVVEMTDLVRMLMERGYAFDPRYTLAPHAHLGREVLRIARHEPREPLEEFNEQWDGEYERRRGTHRFTRGVDGWPIPSECSSTGKAHLAAGMVKFFRHRGRLMRGVIYPSMNDQWTVHLGGERWWGTSRELFDGARPDIEPRRFVPDQAKRLKHEAEKATKAGDWRRLEGIARTLARMAGSTPQNLPSEGRS